MNEEKASVAILVPIYGGVEQELKDLISDVAAQDIDVSIHLYFAVEITKTTIDIENVCKSLLGEQRNIGFTIIALDGQRGLGFALFQSLQDIREDLVLRHDLGDRMYANRISATMLAHQQKPSAAVIYSQANIRKGDFSSLSKSPMSYFSLRLKTIFGNPIIHPTVGLNLKILRQYNVNYDPKLRYCEDLDLWLKIMNKKLIFLGINEALIEYYTPLKLRPKENWQTNLKVRLNNFGSPNIIYSMLGIIVVLVFLNLPKFIQEFLYDKRP